MKGKGGKVKEGKKGGKRGREKGRGGKGGEKEKDIRAPPPSVHVKTWENPQERTWDSASFLERERDVIFSPPKLQSLLLACV